MAITRQSQFGFPPRDPPPSSQTVRLVPLTTGVLPGTAWPLYPPGSAQSMTNFLPLDGSLIPRSRLSSVNTIRTIAPVLSMANLATLTPGIVNTFISGQTKHGLVQSNGSISQASFISSFGLGISSLQTCTRGWQYVTTFSANLNENMLVMAGDIFSMDTLMCLYTMSLQPKFSYLTSAPKAAAVGSFDNYIVALNLAEDGQNLPNRIRWCQRGSPSNWTGEGSGFEDLLDMTGQGTAVVGLQDNRLLVFSQTETWYGLSAAYPAQFQFFPLERSVGCVYYHTIQKTPFGVVFLGSDNNLRILPYGGGLSQIIAPQMSTYLRRVIDPPDVTNYLTNGVYDPLTHLYYLFVESNDLGTAPSVVVNLATGEAGFLVYNSDDRPRTGVGQPLGGATTDEGLTFALYSSGTVCSANSKVLTDTSAFSVLATWQSPVLAADMPGNYKQLLQLNLDYRATSRSTVTLKISTDGGNNYEAIGRAVSLPSAPFAGRASVDLYQGGAFPTLEVTSISTGFELHRLDATIQVGGRR